MGSADQALATVGILSIGDMGLGIAKLLMAHNYRVVTNVTDRSPATQTRAAENNITQLPTDIELVRVSDYILSIVPPRDALATAQRVASAIIKMEADGGGSSSSSSSNGEAQRKALLYMDLNAISPATARSIESHLSTHVPQLRYLDGGIIGGPPSLATPASESNNQSSNNHNSGSEESQQDSQPEWNRPGIPLSGPFTLSEASDLPSADHLSRTLNIRPVAGGVGSATGLKMCFAALSKGFTGLAIQSFTTAASLGVLEDLKDALALHNPNTLRSAERGLPGMCPKAYRWVREMEEIADTFEVDGGFTAEESIFRSVARIYEFVAEGTVLGEEKVGKRVRGKTAMEVADVMGEALRARKEKTD